MDFDYCALAKTSIRDLIPYQPGKPVEELERELGIRNSIKLASNENALGPSPEAVKAAETALFQAHIYPDGGCFALKEALGAFLSLNANQLTVGNGSENLLEIIIKTFLNPEDEVIISEYAFITIPLLVKSYGAKIIWAPAKNYGHDLGVMRKCISKKTKLVFIVNPNNPTGTYIQARDLKKFLDDLPLHVLVVIDEAYYEYIPKNDYPKIQTLLHQYPNLIVTRTFSKIYGLAALRIGYAMASVAITDILNRARLPFNVNAIAAMAARAALTDSVHVLKSITMNINGKQQLEEGLKILKIPYIHSFGNFITLDVKQVATDIYQKLLLKGVIVRPLTSYAMPMHLRVTIGTYTQNERFLSSLHAVLRN